MISDNELTVLKHELEQCKSKLNDEFTLKLKFAILPWYKRAYIAIFGG